MSKVFDSVWNKTLRTNIGKIESMPTQLRSTASLGIYNSCRCQWNIILARTMNELLSWKYWWRWPIKHHNDFVNVSSHTRIIKIQIENKNPNHRECCILLFYIFWPFLFRLFEKINVQTMCLKVWYSTNLEWIMSPHFESKQIFAYDIRSVKELSSKST